LALVGASLIVLDAAPGPCGRLGPGREHVHAPSRYNEHMDTTIRNLDERAYRELKARAALSGKTIGELVTEAIRGYLARPTVLTEHGSLCDLTPEAYPKGNERLSEQVDAIVDGV
jgi:plasmid stability protein